MLLKDLYPGLNEGAKLLSTEIQGMTGPTGNVYYVCATTDTNYALMKLLYSTVYNDGSQAFCDTLEQAYAKCVTNRNDVIALNGNTTHAVSTGIDWTKNRIHVVGMDGAGSRLTDQGAKISLSGAVDSAYVLKISGTRNSFHNVKTIQSSTHANALNVVQDSSEGTLYENCSFIFGVANNLGSTSASEFLAGNDSATFIDCEFGADTLLTTAARAVFLIKTLTTEFKSNRMRGCTFKISSSSSTAAFIRLNATTDILFSNLFEKCNFVASVDSAGGIALAECVQTGTGTSKGSLLFSYPSAFNVTAFATATSGRNAAVQIVAPTSVATTEIGIKPTA